jgi:hypothetical protein
MLADRIKSLATRSGTEIVLATADGAVFSGKIKSFGEGVLYLDGSGSAVVSSPSELADAIESIAKAASPKISASTVAVAIEHVCWMMVA